MSFKIKRGHVVELVTPEMMKSLGGIELKIRKLRMEIAKMGFNYWYIVPK